MSNDYDSSAPSSRRASSSASDSSSSSAKSGGWFHSLKKTLQKTTASNTTPHTSDPEFDVAKENFTKLNDTVFRLRDKLNNYIQHAYGLFSNSNGAALDLVSLLEDTSTPHPYTPIIADVKFQHAKLVGDRETALAHLLSEECLLKLDTEIEMYKELNKRITIRGEMLSELEYYVQKVDGLKKERDEKLAKGKDEKPADVEKFERNISKMEQKKNEFTAYNANVVVDMTTCYRNRVLLLGPVLSSFTKVERELVRFYGEAMAGIRLVDEREAQEGMSRIRSSSQEQASHQLSEQQNTNPILNTRMVIASQQQRRNNSVSIDRQNSISGAGGPLPSPSPATSQGNTFVGGAAPPAPPSATPSPPNHQHQASALSIPTTPSVNNVYPNPLSGMNGTPAAGPKETSMGESEKFSGVGGGEKRNSLSGAVGAGGVGGGAMEGKKEEVNPFESSLEAEKRNSAVFSQQASGLVE